MAIRQPPYATTSDNEQIWYIRRRKTMTFLHPDGSVVWTIFSPTTSSDVSEYWYTYQSAFFLKALIKDRGYFHWISTTRRVGDGHSERPWNCFGRECIIKRRVSILMTCKHYKPEFTAYTSLHSAIRTNSINMELRYVTLKFLLRNGYPIWRKTTCISLRRRMALRGTAYCRLPPTEEFILHRLRLKTSKPVSNCQPQLLCRYMN